MRQVSHFQEFRFVPGICLLICQSIVKLSDICTPKVEGDPDVFIGMNYDMFHVSLDVMYILRILLLIPLIERVPKRTSHLVFLLNGVKYLKIILNELHAWASFAIACPQQRDVYIPTSFWTCIVFVIPQIMQIRP